MSRLIVNLFLLHF